MSALDWLYTLGVKRFASSKKNRYSDPPEKLHEFAPYERLASLWPEIAEKRPWAYPELIRHLRARGYKPRFGLDLAAGTGEATQLLREVWPQLETVYAIDRSPEMLRVLESKEIEGVETLLSDFARFSVPAPVDIAICSGDSLNYVNGRDALLDVFNRVRASLEPGGRFLFDVHRADVVRNYPRMGLLVANGKAIQCFDFDEESGVCRDFVVFEDGTERHERYLHKHEDVTQLLAQANFDLRFYFASYTHRYYSAVAIEPLGSA